MKIKPGDSFTDWTVIKLEKVDSRFNKRWQCKCTCGNICVVNHGDLTSGKSKRCKKCGYLKCSEKNTENLTGRVIGKWKVIERTGTSKHRRPIWKCQCSCGNIRNVTSNNLLLGLSKGCGKCNEYKTIKGRAFSKIICSARKRNIDICISKEDIYNKIEEQNYKCALSGVDIILSNDKNNTASLDRIDSSKPYTVDNIQWVHKDVNYMKNRYTEEYFIDMCSKIHMYRASI